MALIYLVRKKGAVRNPCGYVKFLLLIERLFYFLFLCSFVCIKFSFN